MDKKDRFLSDKKRYRPIVLPQEFSDEEMVRDWNLSSDDQREIRQYRIDNRLFIAVQLCVVRLYGRFLKDMNDLSPRILSHLSQQLNLPPTLTIQAPPRKATYSEQRQHILSYLGFGKFNEATQAQLEVWLAHKARQGLLPQDLFERAESYLLTERILLPGTSVLERLIIHVCAEVHTELYDVIYQQLSTDLRETLEQMLMASKDEQGSFFSQLKVYPPQASISSLRTYIQRYFALVSTGIDAIESQLVDPTFQDYLFKQARKYNARDLKRFDEPKRYALLICYALETRKILLDHLAKMHDQYMQKIQRESKNIYEKKQRDLRRRQKKAVDVVLKTSDHLLTWLNEDRSDKRHIWQHASETEFRQALDDLRVFKTLQERGYGDILMRRYPSLRKYFADFIHLPFDAATGSEPLLTSLQLLRLLDSGDLKTIPDDVPTEFVPRELRLALYNEEGKINRNVWEMGIALALKDALRSGNLFLAQSRHYVAFWNLLLNDTGQPELEVTSPSAGELDLPSQDEARQILTHNFQKQVIIAQEQFEVDAFASIQDRKLKLKRDDKLPRPTHLKDLQKVVDTSLHSIRIEHLLMEVDQHTRFSRHFKSFRGQSKPAHFYKTLLAVIISQATNLGVVAMSHSVSDVTIDMLRGILHDFVREETLQSANAEIVNQHHQLPLSFLHGTGDLSSSDAQRFGIRASSLLASYYPRYYGYYRKAIGIYTHVSDQYAVFSTRVISCSPREALYVLDGLLENNTILKPKKHTTDTHGYTEIIFALCYLLGYEFMPRIRDLKDQQLYRINKDFDYGVFTPLMTKTANIDLVVEQWPLMGHVVLSLQQRTAPAHVVVQRLLNSYPADRLSMAFTHLGRIIKTQYILRYLTDPTLRYTVQRQLNKGEYRHKLPRWIFFANQGEFTTGDYEEIMNKASCLSLVSNAILYWNTLHIHEIVTTLRQQGEIIEDETLSHISLLPFKHVLPHGTYFIEDPSL
jgi:TnpA family transposase